jgi:hypothetical protein
MRVFFYSAQSQSILPPSGSGDAEAFTYVHKRIHIPSPSGGPLRGSATTRTLTYVRKRALRSVAASL